MLNRDALLREVLAMRDRADQIVQALGGEGYTGELQYGMKAWYDFGGALLKITVGEVGAPKNGEPTRWGYAPPPYHQFWTTEQDFRHHIIRVESPPADDAVARPVGVSDV